ncbi:MAG: type II secretion system GspH family protein [candidate division Zixibacteria bacterium]|nr:type II secretion system GspH family protein [candidate division Zixibacteria bacterium]
MRKNPAYSLVELIVVIGIIAILAVPGILGVYAIRSKQALRTSAETLSAVLKRAHIYAREGRGQASWEVEYLDNKSFELRSNDGVTEKVEAMYVLSAPTEFDSGYFLIRFDQGVGTTKTPMTIILKTNPRNEVAQVSVSTNGVVE